MAIDPMTLYMLGQGLGAIGGMVGAGKSVAQKRAERMLPGYEDQLNQGISLGDIANMGPVAMNAAMPEINAIAGQASSRYGQSGYARGAAMSGIAQSFTPQMLALLKERLLNNQQNRRLIYSTNAQLAAGA